MKCLFYIPVLMVLASSLIMSQQIHEALQLWSGKDFANWEFIAPSPVDIHTVCKIEPESVLVIAGNPIGYLATIDSFENYKLHLEYRWPGDAAKNSNSGILVNIASGPMDRNTWPLCFQIQTKITRAGDLLPMAGAKFFEPLSTPPGAKTPQLERRKSNSEKPPGEWNRVDIVCLDSTIECMINGVIQNRVTKCEPHIGKIGLQLEGFQYEVRNIWLTRLE